MRILITGGAGFIGSHLADELIHRGHSVRALDNLTAQVHGDDVMRPAYLHNDVELIAGDVRDPATVRRALANIDVVYHFAAAVGVGQSMYEIAQYVSINNCGTATLLQELTTRPVKRLIVGSSMSLYGEGLYTRANGHVVGASSDRSTSSATASGSCATTRASRFRRCRRRKPRRRRCRRSTPCRNTTRNECV